MPDDPFNQPSAAGAATILAVEDEAGVLRIVERVLKAKGFRVLTAASGAAALKLLQDATFPIDLLLTDLELPDLDGWALASRALAARPKLRVVFMSGHPEPDDVPAASGAARFGYLAKPFTTTALAVTVLEQLE